MSEGQAGEAKRFGTMTIERWFREGLSGKRVLLDGVDITDRCNGFDDELGEAYCFAVGDGGMAKMNADGTAAVETLKGKIEVR